MMANVDLLKSFRDMERVRLRTELDSIYNRVVKAEDERDKALKQLAEYNKDDQIAKLLEENEKLKAREYQSFIITPEERDAINSWKEKHIQEKHSGNDYAGAIGGRYTYEFIPTSIGTIGYIKCHCGEEFCFREL